MYDFNNPYGYGWQPYNQNYPPAGNALNNNYSLQPQPAQEQIPVVNGVEGVKAYPMGPNSSKMFLDGNDKGLCWIKQTDSAGYPKIESYRMQGPINTEKKEKAQYDEVMKRLDKIEKELGDRNVNS